MAPVLWEKPVSSKKSRCISITSRAVWREGKLNGKGLASTIKFDRLAALLEAMVAVVAREGVVGCFGSESGLRKAEVMDIKMDKVTVIRGRESTKRVVGFSFRRSPNQALSAAHHSQLVPSAGRKAREQLLEVFEAELDDSQAPDIFSRGKGLAVGKTSGDGGGGFKGNRGAGEIRLESIRCPLCREKAQTTMSFTRAQP